jgi:thioredoxin 1
MAAINNVSYMNNLKVIQQQSINNPEQLIIIDFYAKWCGPCKQLSHKLEELANATPAVKFYKTDVDDELAFDIISTFPFTSLPTLVYFKGSKEVGRTTGANIETVRTKIQELTGQ